MYTPHTQNPRTLSESSIGCQRRNMSASTTLYVRHTSKCSHKDRNYRRCGCPIWFQRLRRRWSAETNNWDEALKKAAHEALKAEPLKHITVKEAVNLYLIKRSKKFNDPNKAPYNDRWLLKDGSKRQPSVTAWAARNNFARLDQITAAAMDRWRNTWVFREESYSMKIHNAVIKAFFTWAVRFDYLESNPFDKLDRIVVTPVPTLPLTSEEFSKLLSCTDACGPACTQTMTTIILLMRWSGLAILDASCLRRDGLGLDNRLRTYRKKTGEYVHVLLPAFVADQLRSHGNAHPDYFFWNKSRFAEPKAQANSVGRRLRRIYDKAGISPRGAHRLRDTFAVENLNAGMLIEDLAMLLGHSNTTTTWQHYAPWVKSRQIKLDGAVERALAAQLNHSTGNMGAATVQ